MREVGLRKADFPYRADGQGVLYYLGCALGGEGGWVNPAKAGAVRVTCCPGGSGDSDVVVAYDPSCHVARPKSRCEVWRGERNWIEIELPVACMPTAYQFSSPGTFNQSGTPDFPRDWDLYGTNVDTSRSDQDTPWYNLAEHTNDNTLQYKRTRGAWLIKVHPDVGFHRFRLVSRTQQGMALAHFELFGTIEPRQ